MGSHWRVPASGHVLGGEDITETLLRFVDEQEITLILLGTDVRVGSQRLALGRRVEELLATAPCPVVVVNAPDWPEQR